MSIHTAVARFRQRQADLFTDEATIRRPSTSGSLNPTTNVWTPTAATQIYSGVCLIRAMAWEGTDAEVGAIETRLRRYRAKFPVDTSIEKDDIITPTESTYDASLIGRFFRVTDVIRDGWEISRWAICEEVTGDV